MLAGLRHGRTLGTPLALVVRNRDHANWAWGMSPWPPEGEPAGKGTKPVTLPRPGHADLAGVLKFGHDDVRDALERASARHTAVHVAAGAVAKALLRELGDRGRGRRRSRSAARAGRRRSARPSTRRAPTATRSAASSRCARTGVPPGLGSYATKEERLDARLAAALMGIQAVKGVEVGDGFALARVRGSAGARRDRARGAAARASNRAGGIEAGVTNGEELVVRAAMKPLPTLMRPLRSVDLATGEPARGARRAERRRRGRGARGRRRGGGRLGARPRRAGEVRRRLARRLRRRAPRLPGAHPVAHRALTAATSRSSASWAPARRRVGRGGGRAPRPAVRRPRRRDRARSRHAPVAELFGRAGRAGVPRGRGGGGRRGARRAEPAVVALGGGARPLRARARGARRARVHACSWTSRSTRRGGASRRRPAAGARRGRVPPRSTTSGSRSTTRSPTRVPGTRTASCSPPAAMHVELGALELLGELVPGDGPVALVSDARVAGIHGADAQLALGGRLAATHELPAGEEAKPLERSRAALGRARGSTATARSSRSAAAARPTRRGSRRRRTCAACPGSPCRRRSSARSTPRSAARRRSTSRRARTSSARSTGPRATSSTRRCSRRFPTRERRAGHGRGREDRAARRRAALGARPSRELVRRCAAFKAAVCLRDPHDSGRARCSTSATRSRTRSRPPRATELAPRRRRRARPARGAAALGPRRPTTVERRARARSPSRVDRDARLGGARRDKKARDGASRLVLLEAPGRPAWGVELPGRGRARARSTR